MYHWRLWLFVGMTYFVLNAASGYFYCIENFCPGDSETDWVYEYTDNDGKKFIVSNGKAVPKEQYLEAK